MTHYLIEYRFQGRAKLDIRHMIFKLDNKFHLGILKSKRPIPHITFAGPLTTNDEARLIGDFTSLCKSTYLCSFKVNGFGHFKDSRVVFIDIVPSQKLDEFRWNLAQKLKSYCTLRNFDYKREFKFHATLARDLDPQDFTSVKNYIETQDPPKFKHYLIRATILKNGKILYEYDFLQRKLLNHHQSLDRKILAKTMKLLAAFYNRKYNPNLMLDSSSQIINHRKITVTRSKNSGIINRIKKFFRKIF